MYSCWEKREPARNWWPELCTPCPAARASWFPLIVRQSPANCSNLNCLAMKKVPLPALTRRGLAGSKWPGAAHCFSTRLATCLWRCSQSCCGRLRTKPFRESVAARMCLLISGWSAPPIRKLNRRSMREVFGPICISGSMSFRCRCRHWPSAVLTFR